jgi:uncharacterized membrane protein (UPF0127 family)
MNGYVFNHTRQAFLVSNLRIANTHWARMRGLIGQGQESFRSGAGLWIVPSRGIHTFFMRIPIDVIYLDEDRKVVHIEENVAPWRFAPILTEAVTVLEVPAHTVYETGTEVGDSLEINCNVKLEQKAVAS